MSWRRSALLLICGGTGCLAGGSAKLYEHMKELAAEHENVQVEIGPEIAHIGVHKSGCHGFCEMGPLLQIEPEGFLYTHVRLEDCDEIIERTILGGEAVERLLYELNGVRYAKHNEIPFYAKQQRVVSFKLLLCPLLALVTVVCFVWRAWHDPQLLPPKHPKYNTPETEQGGNL